MQSQSPPPSRPPPTVSMDPAPTRLTQARDGSGTPQWIGLLDGLGILRSCGRRRESAAAGASGSGGPRASGPKKDKWGQPIAAASDEPAVLQVQEQEIPEEPVAAAAEEAGHGAEGYECGKVVASGMPYTTTEEEIRGLFDKFGPIRSLQLSRFPDSGNFRGLAFVTFESDEVAMKSLELDGHELGRRFMRVERCRITASSKRQKKSEHESDPEKPEECLSAYVGNLSWNITEKDLQDFFKSSRIASIRFAIDKRTGDSRGFCHVDFEDDESLEKAVGMNQSELRGRPVKIAYAIINRA